MQRSLGRKIGVRFPVKEFVRQPQRIEDAAPKLEVCLQERTSVSSNVQSGKDDKSLFGTRGVQGKIAHPRLRQLVRAVPIVSRDECSQNVAIELCLQ